MAVVLITDRLLFRDHESADVEAFCAMEADAEVRRYVGGAPRTREAAEHKFNTVYLPPVTNGLALWATVYRPNQTYIGYCGVYPHFSSVGEPIPGEGTLAFYLARQYWGRGLATEAGRAFIEHGFDVLGLNKVVATVQEGNAASLRVLQKLNFTHTGTEVGNLRTYHHFELIDNVPGPSSTI